jgi:hypothetical protein
MSIRFPAVNIPWERDVFFCAIVKGPLGEGITGSADWTTAVTVVLYILQLPDSRLRNR